MRYSGEIITSEQVCQAIHDKRGVIQYAADSIPCDPRTIYRMMKTHPEVKQAVDEAREAAKIERLDMNEMLKEKAYKSAFTLLSEFDTTMTIFALKYLCNWEEKQKSNIHIQLIEKPYRDEDNTPKQIPVQEISDSSMGSPEIG